MNKQGFIILECLIYCAIAAWLLTELVGFVINIHLFTQHSLTKANHLFATHCAVQNFARDVSRGISCAVLSPTQLIITGSTTDTGWAFENKLWRRIRGKFDNAQRVWIKRHTTTALDHVVSVTVQQNNKIIAIYLATDYLKLTRYITCP